MKGGGMRDKGLKGEVEGSFWCDGRDMEGIT